MGAHPSRGHGARDDRGRVQPADRAEHRLLGGRAPGDHRRPRLPRRRVRGARHESRHGPVDRPDDGAHHVPVRGGVHREVRPVLPVRGVAARVRRRLRRRKLPRPSGPGVPGALRRAQLSLPQPGHGLLRPVLPAGRPRRSRGVAGADDGAELRQRLALLHRPLAAHRPALGECTGAGDLPRAEVALRP